MQSLTQHGPTQRAIILQQFYLHSVLNARCFPPGSSATEFPGWHLNDFGQLSSCPCTHTGRLVHYISLMKSLPPGPQLPWQAGVHRENINTPHKPGQWIQTQDHAARWW